MSDVDKLQVAEEAAAQRAEQAAAARRERQATELREAPARPMLATRAAVARRIPLRHLHAGDNIRLDLPEIQELALSIREVGLLTPLLVRPWDVAETADGPFPADAEAGAPQFRLIAGHRRHAALTALADAGLDEFESAPCEVREGLTEADAYALMLTENVQRVPLEPIQAARALRLLLDLNPGMDAGTLARSLGLRPAWASMHLKLLDLPQEVQDRLEAGDLSVTIADLLRRGQSAGRIDEDKAAELARQLAAGEITTARVRAEAGPAPRPNTPAPRTLAVGPDGAPLEDADRSTWVPMTPAQAAGGDGPAAASAVQRENPYARGAMVGPVPSPPVDHDRGLAPDRPQPPVVPWEDRLDAYLLGRALREWAEDDYLDELGIDRVQAESYAMMLGFEERIAAIRHLSATLMDRDRQLVPAG